MLETDGDLEEKTLNVRQGTFAVCKKGDRKSILRTGFIGPCVAFYGINADKGVAFMSHIDGKIFGLKAMVERLDRDAEGDLHGFSLYLTTNYTFTLRILVLALASILLSQLDQLAVLDGLLIVGILYFFFGSVVQVYLLAVVRFGTWKVVPKNPWQVSGRVEALIDASSTTGPAKPCKDSLPFNESRKRYRSTYSWLAEMKSTSRD